MTCDALQPHMLFARSKEVLCWKVLHKAVVFFFPLWGKNQLMYKIHCHACTYHEKESGVELRHTTRTLIEVALSPSLREGSSARTEDLGRLIASRHLRVLASQLVWLLFRSQHLLISGAKLKVGLVRAELRYILAACMRAQKGVGLEWEWNFLDSDLLNQHVQQYSSIVV